MNNTVKTILIAAVLAALGIAAYATLTAPDTRSVGEKVGDSIESLGDGVDDAARELEDRTPVERIGDGIKDTADDAADSVNDAVDDAQ